MNANKTSPHAVGIILEEQTHITLAQVSAACCVHAQCIVELVEEGILTPVGVEPHRWTFTGVHIHRAKMALRLQRDLGVNLAGAALALQLLDEIQTLRARLQVINNDINIEI